MSRRSRQYRKQASSPPAVAVTDAVYFSPSGLGTLADRTRGVSVGAGCTSDDELALQYENDGLFSTLISRVVNDALSGGFSIKTSEAEDGERATDRVRQWSERTGIEQVWRQHGVQTKIFGGAVMAEITRDRNQSVPRRGFGADSRFMTLAPSEIQAAAYQITDPFSPDYQMPASWQLSGQTIDPSWLRISTTPRLYSTNLGVRSSSGQRYIWTGPAKARQFIDQLKAWGMSVQAATSALQTLSQLVLKSGTFKAVQLKHGSPDVAAIQTVYWNRLQDLADRRSSMQPIGVNVDESLEILTSSIGGISDVLDRLMVALAAAAEMPVTVAFGVSPGGFGTGESEQKIYNKRVQEYRRLELTPLIRWTLERAFGEEALDWTICYEPIDLPTAAEEIEMRLKQSQIDATYLNWGVVTADEVALSRFTGEYSTQTQINVENRTIEFDEPEVDEPDEPDEAESESDVS